MGRLVPNLLRCRTILTGAPGPVLVTRAAPTSRALLEPGVPGLPAICAGHALAGLDIGLLAGRARLTRVVLNRVVGVLEAHYFALNADLRLGIQDPPDRIAGIAVAIGILLLHGLAGHTVIAHKDAPVVRAAGDRAALLSGRVPVLIELSAIDASPSAIVPHLLKRFACHTVL